VRLGEEILPVVEEPYLCWEILSVAFLRESYRPGETLGTAFARFYARLFAEWGVILLDASDADWHRVAAPVERAAIERAEEWMPPCSPEVRPRESWLFPASEGNASSVLLFRDARGRAHVDLPQRGIE